MNDNVLRNGIVMATLSDVAKKANVSRNTVSKIINLQKLDEFKEDTIQRVKETARLLNYQPHYFAQSLKKGSTGIIGIQGGMSSFFSTHAYFTKVYHGIRRYLAPKKYMFIFNDFINRDNNLFFG